MAYTDMHVETLGYVSEGKAYIVPMVREEGGKPAPQQNSSAAHLSDAGYTKVNYLGVKQYLVAHDDDADTTVLITPQMGPNDAPLDIGDRKPLSVTFPKYGDKIDGYLFYNYANKGIEKCSLDMSKCASYNINGVGNRDFEGDIPGTTYSAFVVDGTLYRVDKAGSSVESFSMGSVKVASGHGTTAFQGSSYYFVGEDHNLYQADFIKKKVMKITKESNERLERIRAFTDDWVIYGSDTLLMATKKGDSSDTPIILAETTLTSGYKYVKDYDMADTFLFVRYEVNTTSGDTAFSACTFANDSGEIECKKDAFWAGVAIAKNGKISPEAGFPYSPYAYVRVDETDGFGGGKLKAIDPAHPMADGITMGSVEKYNFQTFLSNSTYAHQMLDDNGGIVLYAKNDTNFHVDAFYMNLLKENSLKQLTDLDPGEDIYSGRRDHCHGRHCMICHSFAGGKIYTDTSGKRSAYGYRIQLKFEDGSTILTNISKGKGENFSIPLQEIKGDFRANVLDENGTIVNNSAGYYHEGKRYGDCNYCHVRAGSYVPEIAKELGVPGTISATK